MRRLVLFIALLAACGEASAHGTVKGLGNFFGGAVHPLVEPTHLISLIALGLVIGQRGTERAEAPVLCFAAGSVGGLALAGFGWPLDTDTVLLGIAALAGIVVATDARLPVAAYGAVAAVVGAGIGLGSRPDSVSGSALAMTLLGVGFGATAWLLNVVALVNQFRRPWLRILVRVLGSWTSAASVLVLALWISGRHAQPPELQPKASLEAPRSTDTRRP